MTTMTRKLLMTAAAVTALAAPLASQAQAQAQEAVPAPVPGAQPAPAMIPAPAGAPRTEAPSPELDGMALRLAGKLSAAEIFLGITAEQESAWRAYTSAVLALAEPPTPPAPAGMAEQSGATRETGVAPAAGATPPLMSELLARQMVARAQEAQTLLDAIQGLRGALTPEQLAKLARIEPEFAPGPRGMHDGGRMEDRGGKHGGPQPDRGRPDQGRGGPGAGWPGQGSPEAHQGPGPDGRGPQSGPQPGPQHGQLPPPGLQPPRN